MPDLKEQLRDILTRVRARDAAAQQLKQLDDQSVEQDVSEVEMLQIKQQREEIIEAESAKHAEVERYMDFLETVAKKKMSPPEIQIFVSCLETVSGFDYYHWLRPKLDETEDSSITPPWAARVGDILELSTRVQTVEQESRMRIVRGVDYYLEGLAKLCLRRTETETSEVMQLLIEAKIQEKPPQKLLLPGSASALIRYRTQTSEPISLQLLEACHDLIGYLRDHGLEDQALVFEDSISSRELDTLATQTGVLHTYRNKERLARLLVKQGQRVLSQSMPTPEKLRLIGVLQAIAGQADAPACELRGFWLGTDIHKQFGNCLRPESLTDGVCGLAAALYLAKLYNVLGDKPRKLYYARLFVDCLPWLDIYKNDDLTLPWTKQEQEEASRWLSELEALVNRPSKQFEALSIAEITAMDAKQIRQELQKLPEVLTEQLVRHKLVPSLSVEQATEHMQHELGPAWQQLDATAKQCLATAEIASKLPDECDFSCASNLYWKAFEIQLRERVFKPVWTKVPQVNARPTDRHETILAKFFEDRIWGRALKPMNLQRMLHVLQNALDPDYCRRNRATQCFRDLLPEKIRSLVSRPESLDFKRLFDQIENLRDEGVHARALSSQQCTTTRRAVLDALRILFG